MNIKKVNLVKDFTCTVIFHSIYIEWITMVIVQTRGRHRAARPGPPIFSPDRDGPFEVQPDRAGLSPV